MGGHRGVVVVGVAMARSRSRRLREPAGTSATGDARDFCGFSWWEGAIPGFAPIPIGFIGEVY